MLKETSEAGRLRVQLPRLGSSTVEESQGAGGEAKMQALLLKEPWGRETGENKHGGYLPFFALGAILPAYSD